jgi:hypothetical protein
MAGDDHLESRVFFHALLLELVLISNCGARADGEALPLQDRSSHTIDWEGKRWSPRLSNAHTIDWGRGPSRFSTARTTD